MTYPYKVWLFTICTAPVVLLLRMWSFVSANNTEITPAIAFLVLFIVYGAAFSLPALFLFNLLHKDLRYATLNRWMQKAIYSVVGVLLIWITFFVMDRRFIFEAELNELIWPIMYSLCLTIGAFLFSIQPKSTASEA